MGGPGRCGARRGAAARRSASSSWRRRLCGGGGRRTRVRCGSWRLEQRDLLGVVLAGDGERQRAAALAHEGVKVVGPGELEAGVQVGDALLVELEGEGGDAAAG